MAETIKLNRSIIKIMDTILARNEVLKAVKATSILHTYLKYKDDKEIGLEPISQHHRAIQFVSDNLRKEISDFVEIYKFK